MEFKMRILIIYKVILLSQGKSSSESGNKVSLYLVFNLMVKLV